MGGEREGGCFSIKTKREVGLSLGLPDGKLIFLALKVSFREVCEKNIQLILTTNANILGWNKVSFRGSQPRPDWSPLRVKFLFSDEYTGLHFHTRIPPDRLCSRRRFLPRGTHWGVAIVNSGQVKAGRDGKRKVLTVKVSRKVVKAKEEKKALQ